MLLIGVVATAFAQAPKNVDPSAQPAIKGYDPVAYFEQHKPVKGEKGISAEHDGAVYHFSSQGNKALFLANPARYAAQFGGFCAYGMSNGYRAPVTPEAFTIVDQKLYLNYSLKVREMWQREQASRIEKANANWEKQIQTKQ